MESVLFRPGRGLVRLALLITSTLAAWVVYVPIHELLHALGCLATGGTVDELQIRALYGGAILEHIFPFVRAGGDYAGRLTGFDTGGSDLVYLATDAAPYALTLLGGFFLMRLCRRRASGLLFGPAVVLLAAPLISLPGDYYEMGSILVSDALGLAGAAGAEALRHDDLVRLVGEFGERFPEHRAGWALAVGGSVLAGFVLASLTLAGSHAWAGWVTRGGEPENGDAAGSTTR
jgi:hypothetical protein